jgi:energy-coupling factor transporter ATP-binding protein EcfA2
VRESQGECIANAFSYSGDSAVLIRFRVENHRSIRDEQELSLVASSLSEHPESLVRVERYDLDLLRVAAIYGANASGKSTLFDALAFMREAVIDSQRSWRPDIGFARVPFALDRNVVGEPSLFSVDLLLEGVRYEYGFVVNTLRVLEEWLYAYPRGRKQEWFTRDASRESEFSFSRFFPGENQLISSLTRPNSLFLSAAAQNNHEGIVEVYSWFSRALRVVDERTRDLLQRRVIAACKDEAYRASILAILKAADLGIIEITHEAGSAPFTSDYWSTELGRHITFDSTIDTSSVRLKHHSDLLGLVNLPFKDESAGTRALFGISGEIVQVLGEGGTLVVDELDRSLHPHLAMKIVSIFNDPVTNPNNAQLIFNTHDTNLLDTELLRRDQIWFTEKGDDGATRLFPLTDFRARKYENLERGYLQGRYGGVPSVRTPDLRRVAGD